MIETDPTTLGDPGTTPSTSPTPTSLKVRDLPSAIKRYLASHPAPRPAAITDALKSDLSAITVRRNNLFHAMDAHTLLLELHQFLAPRTVWDDNDTADAMSQERETQSRETHLSNQGIEFDVAAHERLVDMGALTEAALLISAALQEDGVEEDAVDMNGMRPPHALQEYQARLVFVEYQNILTLRKVREREGRGNENDPNWLVRFSLRVR